MPTTIENYTMTLQDLLNVACGEASDTKTAAKLGITRQMFSAYRNGRKLPSDEVVNKIIEMRNIDPVKAYMAVYAERVHNPLVAEAFRENRAFAA
jgi:transcriptional regulator with XRE-family HTH domain